MSYLRHLVNVVFMAKLAYQFDLKVLTSFEVILQYNSCMYETATLNKKIR